VIQKSCLLSNVWDVTIRNYGAITSLHNSQITTAPAKYFPPCYVFTSRFLTKASNSGDSLASRAQVLSSQSPLYNSRLTYSPHREQPVSNHNYIVECVLVAAETYLTEPLHRNGHCLENHCLAAGLYTTMLSVAFKSPRNEMSECYIMN
jgi:hypothetical protein